MFFINVYNWFFFHYIKLELINSHHDLSSNMASNTTHTHRYSVMSISLAFCIFSSIATDTDVSITRLVWNIWRTHLSHWLWESNMSIYIYRGKTCLAIFMGKVRTDLTILNARMLVPGDQNNHRSQQQNGNKYSKQFQQSQCLEGKDFDRYQHFSVVCIK